MLKVNHLCVAVLSTVFGAVAVRGQGCAQVVDGVAMFPAGTIAIAPFAFQDCPELKEVVIPATVVTVGDSAFRQAYNLERVTFAPGSQVTSLGQFAFGETNKLQAIVLPNGLLTLGPGVFFGSGLQSIYIPSSITTSGSVLDFFLGTCLGTEAGSVLPLVGLPLVPALDTFLNPPGIKSGSFTVCSCVEFTDSINMCPALNQHTCICNKGKAKSAKNGKIPKIGKTAKKNHKTNNHPVAPPTAPVKPPTAGNNTNSDPTNPGTLQVQSNPYNPSFSSSYMTMGVIPKNLCSALSNDGGAEDKVFNPVVGMCYDLTGNWWRNNIDQISGGGGDVCVDVWEGGYQVGRHQRTCAAAWVATEFAVSHICCTKNYEESGADSLYLTRNEDTAPTCGAQADGKLFTSELGMCYDLANNWWDNKIEAIRGGSATACIDVWEGGWGEGRHMQWCRTDWIPVEFPVSHVCCTDTNSDAEDSFATRSEETQSQEATAQVQIQQVVPASGTCGAKADDQLFSPEMGKCFDLTGNWWENKIQLITGGDAGVCVDVWENGYQEGAHQQVCGTDWRNTFFPISHLCCTDPNSDAENSFATRSEETQSQEATAQVQIQQVVPASGTCGAKVDDQLFSPEMGKCFDLTGNWWENKIQLITGGGAGVCVDVWENGYQEGAHQQACGTDWRNTFFPISHLCCREENTAAAQLPIPASGTCGAKVDDQLFSPELGKCFDLINNWWDNKIQTISGGTAGVCVDVWELGFQKGDHQRVCGSSWVDTSFPISHLCCTEE